MKAHKVTHQSHHEKTSSSSININLLELAAPDADLPPSSCKLCLKLQSGPLSHFPLLRKSKHTPLEYCCIASSSCLKWHFSLGQEPEETNLKQSLSPLPSPCFCLFWDTSYLQYCDSDVLSPGLFVAPSGGTALSTLVYGDKVVFGGFALSSGFDIVDAGVGDIAWINFCKVFMHKMRIQNDTKGMR